MTIPKNVQDALVSFDEWLDFILAEYPSGSDNWQAIRAYLLSQEAEIVQLTRERNHLIIAANDHQDRADDAESRLAAANALTVEWRDLVLNHNAGCAEMCDPDRCEYRPYLEANGRRCPECPVNDMIEIPVHLQGTGDEA